MPRISGKFARRARFAGFVFLIFGGLLAGRLFFIQVAGNDFYSAQAERQLVSYQSDSSVSVRGDIFFRQKDGTLISAATIKDGFLAAVSPALVEDAGRLCTLVKEVVSLNEDDCLMRCDKKDDPFEIIAHRLDVSQAEEIKSFSVPGLNVYPEQWRFYPTSGLASQVLGFVGYNGDELVGRYGLESYYEDVLKGKKENLSGSNSFVMLFFEFGKDLLSTDISSGHDIILTIEPRVQHTLEEELEKLVADWSAESAGGIIINPKTGAIVAMSSRPAFDPNFYSEVENISFFRNPLISDIFELGSIMKPLTVAAALDAGKINKDTEYVDAGYVVLNNKKIENYDGKARGLVDIQGVLNESLNTGAVFVMQQLGKEKFLEYFNNYGLSEKSGVDLPSEVKGDLSNLLSSRDIEYATASFGQGIAMTPLEFVVAASALANGGEVVQPYVTERISVDGGKDTIVEPIQKRKVLSDEASKEITRMLVNVTDDALLGGTVKMEHYSVAAKTGTAQLPKENEPGYYDDQYLHSFFGYGPAFDAEFLVFLYLKKPQGVRYASHTLTQPFMELMKFLFNYYEVLPDR